SRGCRGCCSAAASCPPPSSAACACWKTRARRRAMLLDGDIKGTELPPKTLCLTYDDGPGPHTRELGRFLSDEGISAAFFVVGRHAEGQEDVLRELRDCGHLIGNHTYSHPGLATLAKAGGDVVGEVARADAVIRPFVTGGC